MSLSIYGDDKCSSYVNALNVKPPKARSDFLTV